MNKKMIAILLGVMMLSATGCSSNNDNNVTQNEQNEIEQQGQGAEIKEDVATALPQYIERANNIYKNISFGYSVQATEYNAEKWEVSKQRILNDIDMLRVPNVSMTEAQSKLPDNLKNYLNEVDRLLKGETSFEIASEAEELVRVPLGYMSQAQQKEVNTNVTTPVTDTPQTNENSNQLDKVTYLAECQELYNEVKDMYNQQKDNFVPSEWASFMGSINEKSNALRDNKSDKELSMDQITLANDIRQLASDYGKILQGRGNWDRIEEYTKRIEDAINDVNQQ